MRQANVAAGCVRWSNLRHPNIVRFLGVLECDSQIPALLVEVCVTNLHRFLKSSQIVPLHELNNLNSAKQLVVWPIYITKFLQLYTVDYQQRKCFSIQEQ